LGAAPVSLPWATLATILEGAGVLLTFTGISATFAMTAGVFLGRSPARTDRWFQIGTAVGFSLGVPVTILLLIFQRIF
jgi:hypothetical protein